MKCPNCKETDHEPTAKYCHVCGTMLSENSFSTHTPSEKKNSVVWMVASSLLVAISVMEWLILGSDSIISIIWNVIMFVGFMADWYKFQDDTVINRIKPYFFMVPMSVTACIVETMLFYTFEWAVIISILVILVLTSLLFKRQKK